MKDDGNTAPTTADAPTVETHEESGFWSICATAFPSYMVDLEIRK